MANMQPGTFKAKILNYTISNTKTGNPQVEILFGYNDGDTSSIGGTHHQITWWGHLTEKATPITLKALDAMGFKGKTDEDFARLADGVEGGMLDIEKEVSLVLEEDTKEDGKKFVKVRWVNDPNRTQGFKNALTKGEAKVKLGALNLSGQMAMLRAQSPARAEAPKPIHDDTDFDFGGVA